MALVPFKCSRAMPIRWKIGLDPVRDNPSKRTPPGVLSEGFWASNQEIVVYSHQMGCNYAALAPRRCFVPGATAQ